MVCWHIGEARAFKIRRVCSGYAKSMEGKKRAKWVRKLGGREEDKGGDLLPKLLLTPLPPALCLSAPSLLWVLSKDKDGRYHNRIMSQREVTQSAESPKASDGWSVGGATYKPSGQNASGSRR